MVARESLLQGETEMDWIILEDRWNEHMNMHKNGGAATPFFTFRL